MTFLTTMSRRKQILFAVVAAVTGLVLLEVSAKVVLRIWPHAGYSDPSDDPPLPVANLGTDNYATERRFRALREAEGLTIDLAPDESRGWKLTPGSFVMRTAISSGVATARVNSLGFRGPELGAKETGELRIMGLGDSTMFGFGIREDAGMVPVAAARLSEALSRTVSPVIAATPGYDSEQCLETLRRRGLQVQPDVVVIATLWSDLSPRRFDPTTEKGKSERRNDWMDSVTRPLQDLAIYRLMRRYLGPTLTSQKVGFIGDWDDTNGPGQNAPRTSPDRFREDLRAMHKAAAELGATTVFVALPAPVDFAEAPPPERVLQFREIIREVAAETGAPLVDGPAEFRARGGRISYFLDQVHPAAEGHQLLGEALADLLKDTLSKR